MGVQRLFISICLYEPELFSFMFLSVFKTYSTQTASGLIIYKYIKLILQ